MEGAVELMRSVKVYPLDPRSDWHDPSWIDLTKLSGMDFTPVPWEDNLTFWEVLHELIDSEPPFE